MVPARRQWKARSAGTARVSRHLQQPAGYPDASEYLCDADVFADSGWVNCGLVKSGLVKYKATLLPTSGLSAVSASCVIFGRCIKSHTKSLW